MDNNAKSTVPQAASEPRELIEKRKYLKEQERELKQRVDEYTKTKLELYAEEDAKLKAKDKAHAKYHKGNIKTLRKKLTVIASLVISELDDIANAEHKIYMYHKNN